MRKLIIIAALIASGCEQKQPDSVSEKKEPAPEVTPVQANKPNKVYDFVLDDQVSVSNANYFHAPPKGFHVVCDGAGHYAAASDSGIIIDMEKQLVRTNEWDAIVSCWRTKGIWETPHDIPALKHFGTNWHTCDQ